MGHHEIMMNRFLNPAPDNYEVEGINYCGLHRIPLSPCKISGSFIRSVFTPEFMDAWKSKFPNACIDGLDSGDIDFAHCPRCSEEMERWRGRE